MLTIERNKFGDSRFKLDGKFIYNSTVVARYNKMEELLSKVSEHAETCSIFVYNSDGCTCYYDEIQSFIKPSPHHQ